MKKIIGILVITLVFIACNKDNNTEIPSSKSTTLQIYLHDQPIDYQQVNVDIQHIVIKGYGNNAEYDLTDSTGAGIYNLLDYQNGLDTLLGEITVDYDSISQIRLVLGTENSVMVDSVLYPMATPSAQQSGLKINVHGELTYVDTFVVNLDFDAGESVHQLGNGDYQLHPVIHMD
jgi:hypothetical protein